MIKNVRNTIILYLDDKALREVPKEKIVASIWVKLDLLYITKSLAQKLCLKQQLYLFRKTESIIMVEQLANSIGI